MIDVETIAYAITVVVPFVIGMAVKAHLVSRSTLTKDAEYALIAVRAAEELYANAPESGQQKLESAVEAVVAKTGLSADEANTLVLASVKSLRDAGLLRSTAPSAA